MNLIFCDTMVFCRLPALFIEVVCNTTLSMYAPKGKKLCGVFVALYFVGHLYYSYLCYRIGYRKKKLSCQVVVIIFVGLCNTLCFPTPIKFFINLY